jgi:predicted O-methyltransferase YrrM
MIKRLLRAARSPRASLVNQRAKAELRMLAARHRLPTIALQSLAAAGVVVPPPIFDDMCMPPYIGEGDHDDFAPLLKIARSLDAHVILELGTAYGNTVANLCRALPACRVYTVDAPAELQSGRDVTFSLRPDQIGRVYRQYGYADRVVQILANTLSLDLAPYLGGACVDLAIVDACHDTEYVMNDFLKVQPFIRPDGVVLLHDTHPSMSGHLLGSYRACMRLRRRGFDVRYLENTWWAVWKNGAQEASRARAA